MKIFVSLGSNLDDRKSNLVNALELIKQSNFNIIEQSPIYESAAVDYLDQPDFLNQVLVLQDKLKRAPETLMTTFLNIEKELGRTRTISKGPRSIDIDILFLNTLRLSTQHLTVPHPEVFKRSFIMTPLLDLSSGKELMRHYQFSNEFDNSCWLFVEE